MRLIDVKVQRGVAIIQSGKLEVVVELNSPVNPEKSVILFGGSIYCAIGNNYSNHWDARLDLIDERHIKATRAYPSSYPAEVSWQVVEFVKE